VTDATDDTDGLTAQQIACQQALVKDGLDADLARNLASQGVCAGNAEGAGCSLLKNEPKNWAGALILGASLVPFTLVRRSRTAKR